MRTLTMLLKEMQVDPQAMLEGLQFAIEDAARGCQVAQTVAPALGRQGELKIRQAAAQLALAGAVYALLVLESARDVAERQALVAADLANSAEREAGSTEPA